MWFLRFWALFMLTVSLTSFGANETWAGYLKGYSKVTVVFIPGIYGSILQDEDKNVFWGEDGIGKDGLSLERFPKLKPYLFQDVQFSIGLFGKTIQGYSGIRQNLQMLGQKVLVFPYDWRRSNKKSAEELAKFLCDEFPQIKKDERLVFVAHSMGGLVLRHWIKDHMGKARTGCQNLGIENINSFTFAGTPHAGSLEPIRTMFNGKTSLDDNPIYSFLFTKRMASDAITFESAYELLPAASIGGAECVQDESTALRLSMDIGTGKPLPVFLNDIENWRSLSIPVSLPDELPREDAMTLIEKRISVASTAVCELHKYQIPPAVSAKMAFIVGELKDKRGEFSPSTVDSVNLIVRPGKPVEMHEAFGKGDGTVPYWSAEPGGMYLFGRAKFPYPSNRHHAEILDDASIVAHLQRVLEDAAYDVALLSDQPFDIQIDSREKWFDAAKQASSLPLDRMSPEVYAGLISFLSSKAEPLGISGLDIYRGAKAYEGGDANSYRAVGYALASEVGTDLNDISKAWANQNAAISLLKVGNEPLAAATAIRTGEVTAQFVNQPDIIYEAKYLREFSSVEQGWKSIVSSTLDANKRAVAREIIAESKNYDTSIFNDGALGGYAILPKDILGVVGNGT